CTVRSRAVRSTPHAPMAACPRVAGCANAAAPGTAAPAASASEDTVRLRRVSATMISPNRLFLRISTDANPDEKLLSMHNKLILLFDKRQIWATSVAAPLRGLARALTSEPHGRG